MAAPHNRCLDEQEPTIFKSKQVSKRLNDNMNQPTPYFKNVMKMKYRWHHISEENNKRRKDIIK